jgi:two-component system capsular synthesis sensor histidine kinase RcsC
MWSDPNRIEQIVNNLLSNAWKYGASKPVTLEVRVQKRTKNGTDCVQISVIDQGPGISEQEQPRIFEGYFRTREQSSQIGTGLGLTISRKILHLLNGTIELTSRPNEGCRFTVTLPVSLS